MTWRFCSTGYPMTRRRDSGRDKMYSFYLECNSHPKQKELKNLALHQVRWQRNMIQKEQASNVEHCRDRDSPHTNQSQVRKGVQRCGLRFFLLVVLLTTVPVVSTDSKLPILSGCVLFCVTNPLLRTLTYSPVNASSVVQIRKRKNIITKTNVWSNVTWIKRQVEREGIVRNNSVKNKKDKMSRETREAWKILWVINASEFREWGSCHYFRQKSGEGGGWVSFGENLIEVSLLKLFLLQHHCTRK